ncbi:MAG TPA: Holliday junction resolvase RuvX [Polyangiaceae bacterium]|nr:Holliday junction resolvase RuvX [Polyangiaceae bacterium]
MRVLAIDLGSVRVGIAVSDELGLMAHPRPHLAGGDAKRLLAELGKLATEEGVERFLLGVPRHLNGSEGRGARDARRFAAALGRATGLPVTLVDEWLSTREAHSRLREAGNKQRDTRARIDSAAAAVLLQSWLDARASRKASDE